MKAHEKPKNSVPQPEPPDSPLARLSTLWRETLTEPDRDRWREQLRSESSWPEWREELKSRFNLELPYDDQVTRFRGWLAAEEQRRREAATAEEEAAAFRKLGLSEEQLTDELLKRMKIRALLRGDFKLAATALALDLRVRQVMVSERRQAVVERAEAAEVRAEQEKAGAAASKSGLRPETIAKIERELNLL